MRIALAQVESRIGDLVQNVQKHCTYIKQAAGHGTELIVFPELSITGYDVEMSKKAIEPDDALLDPIRKLVKQYKIVCAVGVPLIQDQDTYISMLIFYPNGDEQVYSKQFLHLDEIPYFTPARNPVFSLSEEINLIPAICFELSCEEHLSQVLQIQPDIYLASVAKTGKGIEAAHQRMRYISEEYGLITMLVNGVGNSGEGQLGGMSAFWDAKGNIISLAPEKEEELVLLDSSLAR